MAEENNGAGAEGAGGADTPKFTQKDFDTALGKALGERLKKYANHDELTARAAKLSEVEAQLAALAEEKAMHGKSAEEKERLNAEKAAKALERERAESTTKLTAAEKRAMDAEAKLRDHVVSAALGSGLESAKVLSQAREKAVRLMLAESKVDLDDDGRVASITYGGVAHKNAAEAAAAFLKDNDFLASGPTGKGAGTKPPNAGGAHGQDVFKASADENFAVGLATAPKQISGFTPNS